MLLALAKSAKKFQNFRASYRGGGNAIGMEPAAANRGPTMRIRRGMVTVPRGGRHLCQTYPICCIPSAVIAWSCVFVTRLNPCNWRLAFGFGSCLAA